MLISSRTTLTDMPKNRHLSGYLLVQSCWQIKLTITTTYQYWVIKWTDLSCLCVVVVLQLFATPWTAACHAPLSFTISQSFLKFMSNELAIISHQIAKILELQLQHQSFQWDSGLISFRMDWLDLLEVQKTFKSLFNTAVWKHQFFGAQPLHGPNLTSVHDYWKNP